MSLILTELRIGNIIYPNHEIAKFKGETVKVVSVCESGIIETTSFFYQGAGCAGTTSDNAFGVEITPEILEKFGFVKKDNGWFKLNICKDYINLYFESLAKAELSISGLGMKMPHIQYLHQLQNLYFDLTGEELKPITPLK